MRTLALYSNKGGVGKTAAAVNLSYLAARSGIHTLICDLDPQSSTTYYFRVRPKLNPRAKGFVKGGKAINRSIKGTDYDYLDLLPASLSHRNLDLVFHQLKRSKRRLKRIFGPLKKDYDLVIIDCPPSINLLSENVFNIADVILVPLIPTTLSERSHTQLIKFFKKKKYDTEKIRAFISMIDARKKLHCQLADTIEANFDGVLQSSIPYSADVENMGIHREPVEAFAPRSKAAASYRRLWEELFWGEISPNLR